MLEYDFEQSVTYWIGMTSHTLEQALNEELAPQGITFRQCQVLAWLSLQGELTQAQLAKRLHLEAPTLVGILDRMERDGWVERHVVPGDRRKKLIRPAEKVQPVWRRMVASFRRVRKRATRGLSEAELVTLKSILGKIQHNLRTPEPVEEMV